MAIADFSDEDEERPSRAVLIVSLLGLAAFLAVSMLMLKSYIAGEDRPPAWDQSVQLEIALDYKTAGAAGRWSEVMRLAPKPGMPPFPPLYHLLLGRVADPAGPPAAALWVNFIYFALLCVSIFGIVHHFKPDSSPLAAVVVFSCAPVVQWLLRTQLVDLSVTALAAAAYWALLASDLFRRWLGSLFVGTVFAAGMLHKWSFFSYMVPVTLIGLWGLFERDRRFKVFLAAAIGIGGCLPWYALHLPILIPRLVGATADYAVPVTKGLTFFQYFFESVNSFGLPLFLLGWLGICVPDSRRNRTHLWLLPAWLATSYIFWAVVPNRQMRYLLPGLVPLAAAAACSSWPKPFLWGVAALQLLIAANFHRGWIAPVVLKLPIQPIEFLPSFPPRREDWKIAEIIREAERRSDPARIVSNLTLVANDTYFNGPNFNWIAKRERIQRLKIRGVNSRLCELSEFILVKTGRLGSPEVIRGLPEAVSIISDPNSWVANAYQIVQRFPLPDRSEAVLYQQKASFLEPFRSRLLASQFFTSQAFSAKDPRIVLGPWNAKTFTYPTVDVTAKELVVRKLTVTDVALDMKDVRLMATIGRPAGLDFEDLRFLKLGRLKIRSARVTADDLRAFLESRVKGLKVSKFEIDGTLRVAAEARSLAFDGEFKLALARAPARLEVEVLRLSAGVTAIPPALLGPFQRVVIPLEPNPETPFFIDLDSITLKDGRLTIP